MSLVLRPYQEDLIERARALMHAGERRILIQSPTGSGKTALTAHMLKTAASKGMDSWFVVHRRELVAQSIRAFDQVDVACGVVAAGFDPDRRRPIQVCSIQTLARRRAALRPPRLIVWDECHHVAAGSWSAIFSEHPQAFHIGLTATPERLDGQGLAAWFSRMVEGPTAAWLIERGFLAPYRLYAPPAASVSGVRTRMGDFATDELAAAVDKPTITGDAIAHYRKHAGGGRAVVFCVSVEHSKHVTAQFQSAGVPAEHVDGGTDHETRDAAVRRFAAGRTRVLSNVELFGEGFDLPAMEAAVLLRPTQSLGLYLQQVGRALRPSPGKASATILDHAGNCERFGLPDEPRAWSLAGRADRLSRDGAGPSVRVCPVCFAAQWPGATACRFCGAAFELKPRTVEQVDGELVEMTPEELARRRARRMEQGRAETREDLVAIGRARGYKNPWGWAHMVLQARQARKLAGVR